MNTLKVFCGGNNLELTNKICEKLDIKPSKVTLGYFADGERSISNLSAVRGCDIYIIQQTGGSGSNIWDLMLLIDTIRRASAKTITAVIPYFGYARQDRQDKYRSPISFKVAVKAIESVGINKIVTMDLHTPQLQGFFDVTIEPLSARPVILAELYKIKEQINNDFVLCSPDIGAIKNTRDCASYIGCPYIWLDKQRNSENLPELMSISGDIDGAVVYIVDDIIDSGKTICMAAKTLRACGATRVGVIATHGIFSGGEKTYENLKDSGISDIVVTDSLSPPVSWMSSTHPLFRQLSVADLLAEAVWRLHKNESLQPLNI